MCGTRQLKSFLKKMQYPVLNQLQMRKVQNDKNKPEEKKKREKCDA